jgi:hypothetical protein
LENGKGSKASLTWQADVQAEKAAIQMLGKKQRRFSSTHMRSPSSDYVRFIKFQDVEDMQPGTSLP